MQEIFVIIDANFILLPFQFKIDYLDEIEGKIPGKVKFYIFKQVMDELKAKARREISSNKFLLLLNSNLLYLEERKHDFEIIFDPSIKNPHETSDEFLLRRCIEFREREKMVYLATNDKELKMKARNQKINLIFTRQKKIISIERV